MSQSTRSPTWSCSSTASAERGFDLHDDQRAGGAAAPALRARRGGAGRVGKGGLRGTVQNDVLKEYCARGNYIYPPRPTMRIKTPTSCTATSGCRASTISISGYHIREAGSTWCRSLRSRSRTGSPTRRPRSTLGSRPTSSASGFRSSSTRTTTSSREIAKFRAAQRLWARIMKERFRRDEQEGDGPPVHAQTGGSTLTAQQPENNIIRVAVQALSAMAGGARSIHTNAFDEALALAPDRSRPRSRRAPAGPRARGGRHGHGRSVRPGRTSSRR